MHLLYQYLACPVYKLNFFLDLIMPPRVPRPDANYVPAIEPEIASDIAPQRTRRNGRVASATTNVTRPARQNPVAVQPPPNLGEYIDIDVADSSDEEGSLSSQGHGPSGPAANPPAPGPTTQPVPSTQPVSGSQGGDSRTNVAHDINHFFRRGKKNIEGSKMVCVHCE